MTGELLDQGPPRTDLMEQQTVGKLEQELDLMAKAAVTVYE